MEYLMFVASAVDAPPYDPAEDTAEQWVEEGSRRGIRVRGDRLRPTEDATTIKVRAGELLVTDGPFTESKEWILGYDILECENLDEAIDYASRHPMAKFGQIELRPVWPFE